MAPEAEGHEVEELAPGTVQTQSGFPYHRGSEYTWDLGVTPWMAPHEEIMEGHPGEGMS